MLYRMLTLSLLLLLTHCQSQDSAEPKQEEQFSTVYGEEVTLQSLDFSTTLVTHGLSFASKPVSERTVALARLASRYACDMAQVESDKKETSPPSLTDDIVLDLTNRGSDPYLSLEIARSVAACYAAKIGEVRASTLTRTLFLSIAAHCASRRGATGDEMSRLMSALYDSQEMTLDAFVRTSLAVKTQPLFLHHQLYGTELCPILSGSAAHAQADAPSENAPLGSAAIERVYLGILRGRAPGRIRLTFRDRTVQGTVTIGSKRLEVSGRVGRFNNLVLTGELGLETIELKGKVKDRARKVRGRYNGKIRRRNQPRTARVIGFWEANLEESDSTP
jgi:hypothetical protein